MVGRDRRARRGTPGILGFVIYNPLVVHVPGDRVLAITDLS